MIQALAWVTLDAPFTVAALVLWRRRRRSRRLRALVGSYLLGGLQR